MCYRMSFAALLVLLAPLAGRAQDMTPEQLLPATTQLYLRWDGYPAHALSYNKTALGKMLSGDTGTFITKLYSQLQEGAASVLTVDQLLGGIPPEKLKQLQTDANEATKLPILVGTNGFILAGDLTSLAPPQGQLSLIIPDGGAKPEPLFGAVRLLLALGKIPTKDKMIEGRKVGHAEIEGLQIFWWVEGKHAIVTVGSTPPDVLIKRMTTGKHPRLTSNPIYQKISSFKEFETSTRAYIDVASLAKVAGTGNDPVQKLLSELGVDGLKSLTYYSGFDNDATRSVVELDAPGPRKGLLSLLKGKPFRLADVPPLPPDVISWSMTHLDLGATWDFGVTAIEGITGMIDPGSVPQIQAGIKQLNEVVGVDIRKDLLAALGDKLLVYNSPGDGPLFLGTSVMIKVKDTEKLQGAISQIVKSLAAKAGGQVALKKRTYRGVEVREVYVREKGFPFVPTYAIHDGWLIIGFFPQSVQGAIQRSKGELEAWKPSPRAQKSLDQLPKEVLGMTYSDPVPTMHLAMSLAPLIGGFYKSFEPDSTFEVGSIPTTQEVTRHLFPNVSVFTDDGKTVRLETRDSLVLPFDFTGAELYGVFALFFVARGVF
jgi:hypothetical protein